MRRFRDFTTKEKKEYLAILFLLPFAYIWHLFRKANFRTLSRHAVAVCLSAVMVITLLPIMSITANAATYTSGKILTKNLQVGDVLYSGVKISHEFIGDAPIAWIYIDGARVPGSDGTGNIGNKNPYTVTKKLKVDSNEKTSEARIIRLSTVVDSFAVTFRYHPNGGNQPDNYVTWVAKSTDSFPDSHWNYTNGSYEMTRVGYTPSGYYAKADGSRSVHEDYNFTSYADLCSKYGVSTTANHTIDIYAQWTPNNYTVKFNANGGSGTMANQSFTWDTAQNLTSNAFTYKPTLSFNENGGNAVSDASVAATFGGWEDKSTTTYGDTTYKYTDFDAPGYAIRNNDVFISGFCNSVYNKDGLLNHYVNHGKNEYAGGSTYRAPNTGYIYGYPNGAKVSNLTTTANGTVNLYAKWKYGKTTLPTPQRAGYTFKGWKGDLMDIATLTGGMEISNTLRGTIGSNASYAVTENLIPVVGGATYTSNYEVCGLYSFDANGNFIKRESEYATTHTVSSNAAFVRIEVNTSKGITFDQYKNGLTLTYTLPAGTSFPVGGNQTLTATWTPATYTITFDAQGGTTSLKSLPVVYGSNQNNKIDAATNPTKTDYTFLGWFTEPQGGEQVYQVSNGSCLACTYWSGGYDAIGRNAVWQYAGNVTLYAHWTYSGVSTITFDAQGGTTTLKKLTATYGSSTNNLLDTATNPTKEGYTFDGWFDAPTGGAQVYKLSNGSCIQGAYWTKAWDIAGPGAKWKGPKELTLYAHWIPKKYTVNFNANGGSVGTSIKSVTYDSTYGEMPTPTRENHTFAGWFTSVEGGTQVTSTTAVKITENQILYARWNIDTYTVTWKNHDGSVLETDTGVAYNTTPSFNGATPTKAEDESFTYTFKGWSPTVSAVTGDTVYTAEFTATSKRVDPTYTVTIPATVTEGESFKVSATGVVLNTDEKLTVTLQSDFTLKNEQNAELAFKINDGAITNNAVVLSVAGNGDKNNPLSLTTDNLAVEVAEEAKYSGTYTGTVTFTIAVNPAENN